MFHGCGLLFYVFTFAQIDLFCVDAPQNTNQSINQSINQPLHLSVPRHEQTIIIIIIIIIAPCIGYDMLPTTTVIVNEVCESGLLQRAISQRRLLTAANKQMKTASPMVNPGIVVFLD